MRFSCMVDSTELVVKHITEIQRDNIVGWRSLKCNRKLVSTTSAELVALVEGVKVAPLYIAFIEKLWGKKPLVIFATDSQPLLGWLGSGWVTSDPAMQGSLDLARSRIKSMNGKVLWVPTKEQRADRQTKFICAK